MAKNWTMCEAIEEVANGTKESIADFGGRYPLTTTLMAKAVSGDKEAVVELIKALPEHITVRKIEATLKTGVAEVEANEEAEEVEEKKPVKKEKKAAKEEKEEADGYEAMTAMELFKECKKRGIKAEAKKSEKYYIGLLKKDDAKNAEAEEDGWGEEEDKKPAKKEKKATKKEAEPEETDDDGDEWDI